MTVCSLNYQSQVFSGSGSTSTGTVHIESHLAEKMSPTYEVAVVPFKTNAGGSR